MAARLGKLAVNNTAFFLCDMQEKFRPSIRYYPEIIKVSQRMVSSSPVLALRIYTWRANKKVHAKFNTVYHVDMLNAVTCMLVDVSSVSPSSANTLFTALISISTSTLYVLPPRRRRPKLVLTGTSIPLYLFELRMLH